MPPAGPRRQGGTRASSCRGPEAAVGRLRHARQGGRRRTATWSSFGSRTGAANTGARPARSTEVLGRPANRGGCPCHHPGTSCPWTSRPRSSVGGGSAQPGPDRRRPPEAGKTCGSPHLHHRSRRTRETTMMPSPSSRCPPAAGASASTLPTSRITWRRAASWIRRHCCGARASTWWTASCPCCPTRSPRTCARLLPDTDRLTPVLFVDLNADRRVPACSAGARRDQESLPALLRGCARRSSTAPRAWETTDHALRR
jgi:hypothetical protein